MGLFSKRKTVFVDADILVIGGGMAGCGATYESRYWGRDKKIVVVEKANIERSGAVAQGLYAINCYMGMQWDENQPEDHVRYARNDLMGLVREDLGYDIARHVDSTVHKFEEWGLPIMKDPETGRYLREGKWQIMIHGESYKPIVAEAARKAATEVYNRIMVTHLLVISTCSARRRSSWLPVVRRTSSNRARLVKVWDGPGMPRGAALLPTRCPSSSGPR
jgi:adenylylsulfate reductase subunit A